MKRVWITGGGGQVAHDLIQQAPLESFEYVASSHAEVDISDEQAVIRAINHFKPDAVINTAAYTRVDLAETESTLAYAVNELGAKNIAKACQQYAIPLVHLSTDYVFNGEATEPYTESDAVSPINVYGASKYAGELAVVEHCPDAMIVRVSGVFGVQGANFVKTILRLAREKETMRIVSDQIICPTPSRAIADALFQLLKIPQAGLYHYCGSEATNWHTFAVNIVDIARSKHFPLMVNDIVAIKTSDYATPAKRPAYSVLNCQKIKKIFALQQPDWKRGLADVITALSTY